MIEDQAVNIRAKARKKFRPLNIKRAELRTFTASRSGFISPANLNRKTSDPVRLLLHEDIGMLTEAPGQDTRSRSRRAYDKNRFVRSLGRKTH